MLEGNTIPSQGNAEDYLGTANPPRVDSFLGDPHPVSEQTVNWIKSLEGFSAKPFGDYHQTSIGYGTRAQPGETSIDQDTATQRLRSELAGHAQRIDEAAEEYGYDLTPGQRDALISFDFNTGHGPGLMQVGDGDVNYLAEHMPHYAGGKVNQGLVNRREMEYNRFDQMSVDRKPDPTAEQFLDGQDNGVSPAVNAIGSAHLQWYKAAASINDNLGAMGASVADSLGLDGVKQWMRDYSANSRQRYNWFHELETGDYSANNPFGPGTDTDLSDTINPSLQNSFGTGAAHVVADIPMMVGNPLAGTSVLVGRSAAEAGTQAADAGQDRGGAAAKTGLTTGATLALFHGGGALAGKLLPNALTSPVSRFAAGTAAAGTANLLADAAVQAATGGHVLPQTPREWAERGLFDLGFAAIHGYGEATLPQRLIAAGQQLDTLNGLEQHVQANPDQFPADKAQPILQAIGQQRTQLKTFLGKHAGLLNQARGTQATRATDYLDAPEPRPPPGESGHTTAAECRRRYFRGPGVAGAAVGRGVARSQCGGDTQPGRLSSHHPARYSAIGTRSNSGATSWAPKWG